MEGNKLRRKVTAHVPARIESIFLTAKMRGITLEYS